MQFYTARNVFTNIFLIIISTNCMSVFGEVDSTEPTTQSDLNLISQDVQSNVIKPKPAHCMPELQVVQVKENPNPTTIYFPNCVRINRCGGCCASELLSCQPMATETRNYQIQATKFDGGKFVSSSEIVPLEEHTVCKCDCKTKAKDCTDKQIYKKEECRCTCPNSNERNKCQQQYALKFWNEASCSCDCREIRDCSTGNVFNTSSCSCERQAQEEEDKLIKKCEQEECQGKKGREELKCSGACSDKIVKGR